MNFQYNSVSKNGGRSIKKLKYMKFTITYVEENKSEFSIPMDNEPETLEDLILEIHKDRSGNPPLTACKFKNNWLEFAERENTLKELEIEDGSVIFISTTPPDNPAHNFSKMIAEADAEEKEDEEEEEKEEKQKEAKEAKFIIQYRNRHVQWRNACLKVMDILNFHEDDSRQINVSEFKSTLNDLTLLEDNIITHIKQSDSVNMELSSLLKELRLENEIQNRKL